MEEVFWKKCSNCKTSIGFETLYQRCSVTTCNHERTGLQFCSVSCWSSHVPIYRHRDAWAVEETSPSKSQSILNEALLAKASPVNAPRAAPAVYVSQGAAVSRPHSFASSQSSSAAGQSSTSHSSSAPSGLSPANDTEILIVVSKVKAYIKERSDMNMSADVLEVLSDFLRAHCDEGIVHARADGRKTVMARDFISRK